MCEINKDLQMEREKCSFDVKELTAYIDGGPEMTMERKEREHIMISNKEAKVDVPEEYLNHKEKYETAVKSSIILFSHVRRMQEQGKAKVTNYRDFLEGLMGSTIHRDGTPLALHYIMFMPAIVNQGSEEQQMQWIPRAWNFSIIGSYAQTELGHGTFIRGLETTATYDPTTQEFVLHSPTLTSYKWWPGAMGNTANYCIVVAQLYTKGECHGIHSFIVQVRDEETHLPLPGIKVGDIGAKMGLNAVNNGFLGFDNVRIPRMHMLMKHAKVLEDGTYVKSRNSKLSYGAMVFVRVVIVFDTVNYLSKAVTIAIRYSAVQRQKSSKSGKPKIQILDFLFQQHKIFIGIAACYALRLTAIKLGDTFNAVTDQLTEGNLERLPELHALACCLKAVSTSDTSKYVEACRLACGDHGHLMSSGLPFIYGMTTAACTYEGETTVLLLQTARFLLKTWHQKTDTNLTPTVQYFKTTSAKNFSQKWENSIEGIISGFQIIAMRKISDCVNNIRTRAASGMTYEDAWNLTSVQLVAAAEAHCRMIIISTYYEETKRTTVGLSPNLQRVLQQLVDLYAVYWALENLNDLLLYTSISKPDVDVLRKWYEDLLMKIRPNAVGLVDAFDIVDEMLNSTLGAHDGRVYERIMEQAMKSPLNAECINSSFHKYWEPFPKSKL